MTLRDKGQEWVAPPGGHQADKVKVRVGLIIIYVTISDEY